MVGNNKSIVKNTEKAVNGYVIHYKEQGTNKTLSEDKTVGELSVGDVINESAIDIEGYTAIDPTSMTITVEEGLNEDTFYYIKLV